MSDVLMPIGRFVYLLQFGVLCADQYMLVLNHRLVALYWGEADQQVNYFIIFYNYHMGGFECPDELAGLLVVSVGGEGDVVHRHLQQQLLTRHGGDLIWLRHDVLHTHTHRTRSVERPFLWPSTPWWRCCLETHLGQRALHAVASDDDAVPLVGAPALKELSGQTALHHPWGRHHHAGTNVVKVVHALRRETRIEHSLK